MADALEPGRNPCSSFICYGLTRELAKDIVQGLIHGLPEPEDIVAGLVWGTLDSVVTQPLIAEARKAVDKEDAALDEVSRALSEKKAIPLEEARRQVDNTFYNTFDTNEVLTYSDPDSCHAFYWRHYQENQGPNDLVGALDALVKEHEDKEDP
jgi:hypothetical protein